MYVLQSEYNAIMVAVELFLEGNPEAKLGYSVLRYDGDIHTQFAEAPHIDMHFWFLWGKEEHHKRPTCTENDVRRLAKLTAAELLVIVEFAKKLADQIPNIQVALSRYDAGRCAFVITPTNN